jgi:hypothetical protein
MSINYCWNNVTERKLSVNWGYLICCWPAATSCPLRGCCSRGWKELNSKVTPGSLYFAHAFTAPPTITTITWDSTKGTQIERDRERRMNITEYPWSQSQRPNEHVLHAQVSTNKRDQDLSSVLHRAHSPSLACPSQAGQKSRPNTCHERMRLDSAHRCARCPPPPPSHLRPPGPILPPPYTSLSVPLSIYHGSIYSNSSAGLASLSSLVAFPPLSHVPTR